MQTRYLFVARARGRADSWAPWPGLRPASEESRSAPWVAWRLLGANNRELGRSATIFPDLTECLASIAGLKRAFAEASELVAPDPATRSWYWKLESGSDVLAVAGRPYRRQRECLYSLGQFRAAAPAAIIALRSIVDLTEAAPVPVRFPAPRLAVDGFTPAQAVPVTTAASPLSHLGAS